ncbi:MAG: DNA primase [Oscillospiraceae bacterium]|nr:DNA primase [Oscillospiraceae bacterium]
MAFPENFIDELIQRNDIVDVVGSYVNLSKRSGQNYFGLCPFHNERTPSFAVNPSGQFYHCFGCGKGGGVINFIMEAENLPYPDAVAFLAKRAGMQMPEESQDRDAGRRRRLLELNRAAARWFYEQLATPEGKRCTDYMAKRGISPPVARRFGLGFAPESWDALRNAMSAQGWREDEMLASDLIRRSEHGFYDTFRDRLMFPIIDVRGDFIGFSGRALGDRGAKYLNSRDTMVYNKGRNLFALNLAKKSKSGYLILSEGNIDIVSLHQAGFDSAVASLGTALTPEQARLMSRYTNEVILAYDSDAAGQKASQRAIGILERLDMKVRVLHMEGAKDPDEFIRSKGPDAFRALLEGSEDQVDWRLNAITAKYDLHQPDQKVAFLKEATEMVAALPGQVEREVYAIRVAGLAEVTREAVVSEVERRRRRRLTRAQKEAQQAMIRPERMSQPASRELRYSDPVSAAAEEGLIRLLMLEPALASQDNLPQASDFSSEALGQIYALLRGRIAARESTELGTLAGSLTPDEMNLLVSILQKPEQLAGSERALKDYTTRILEQKERREQSGAPDLNALSERLRDKGKGYHS